MLKRIGKQFHLVQWCLLVALAGLGFVNGIDLEHLQLSWTSILLLKEFMPMGEQNLLFVNSPDNVRTSNACQTVQSLLKSADWLALDRNSSFHRLAWSALFICETDQEILAHFDSRFGEPVALSPLEVANVSEILERNQRKTDAISLRRTEKELANWYINRGIFELERRSNERQALALFQTAEETDSNFNAHKIGLYMYLCLISVRESKSTLRADPCLDFDKSTGSQLSKFLLGRSRFNEGKYDAAIKFFLDSIELDASSGENFLWLARAYDRVGLTAIAEKTLSEGIARAPKYPWNYIEMVSMLERKECYDMARAYLEQVRLLSDTKASARAAKRLEDLADRRTNYAKCAQ